MKDKIELPAGCGRCQPTLPCEKTCGADPFVERGQSHQTEQAKESSLSDLLCTKCGVAGVDLSKTDKLCIYCFNGENRPCA